MLTVCFSAHWYEFLRPLPFVFQLKKIYSRNSVLAKSFTGSTVQAFRWIIWWFRRNPKGVIDCSCSETVPLISQWGEQWRQQHGGVLPVRVWDPRLPAGLTGRSYWVSGGARRRPGRPTGQNAAEPQWRAERQQRHLPRSDSSWLLLVSIVVELILADNKLWKYNAWLPCHDLAITLVIPASWPLAEVFFVPTAVDARTTRSSLFGENCKTLLSDLYSDIPEPASSLSLILANRFFWGGGLEFHVKKNNFLIYTLQWRKHLISTWGKRERSGLQGFLILPIHPTCICSGGCGLTRATGSSWTSILWFWMRTVSRTSSASMTLWLP